MFNIHLSIERWKWNADFGIYVSNKGRFRTRDKKDLPIKIGNKGYCYVYCEGTVNKYRLAHRVVMLTWCPTDDAENLTVDHKDHNKRNNAVDNLEWVTFEENQRRAEEDCISDVECAVEKSEVTLSLPKTRFNKYLIVGGDVPMTIEQFVTMIWAKDGNVLGKDGTKSHFEDIVYKSNKQKICGIIIKKKVLLQ